MSGLLDASSLVDTEDVGGLYRAASDNDEIRSTVEAVRRDQEAQSDGSLTERLGARAGAIAEVGTLPSRAGAGSLVSTESAQDVGERADDAFWDTTGIDPESELLLPDSVQRMFDNPTVGDAASVMVAEPADSVTRAATGERPFDPQDRGDDPFRGIEAIDLAFAPLTMLPGGVGAAAARGGSRAAGGAASSLSGSLSRIGSRLSADGATSAGTDTMASGLLRTGSRAIDGDAVRSIARMDFDEFSTVGTRAGVDDTFTGATRTAREGQFDAAGGLGRVMDELPSMRRTGTDLGPRRVGEDALSRTGATGSRSFDDMTTSLSRTVEDMADSGSGITARLADEAGSASDAVRATTRVGDDAGSGVGITARSTDDAAAGAARTGDGAAEAAGITARASNAASRASATLSGAVARASSAIRNHPILAALGLGTAGYMVASDRLGTPVPTSAQDGPYLYELVGEPSLRREINGEMVEIPGIIFRITRGDEELGYTVFVNRTSVLNEGGQPRTANMSLIDISQAEGSVESDSPNYTPLEPVFSRYGTARRVWREWAEGSTAPDETFQEDDPTAPDGDDGSGWGNAEIVEELGAGWYLARERHTETDEQRFAVLGRDEQGQDVYLNSRGRGTQNPHVFDTEEKAREAFQKWLQRAREGQTEGEPRPSPDSGRPTDDDVHRAMEGSGGILGNAVGAAAENPRLMLYGGVAAFVAIYFISDGEPVSWTVDKLPFVGE